MKNRTAVAVLAVAVVGGAGVSLATELSNTRAAPWEAAPGADYAALGVFSGTVAASHCGGIDEARWVADPAWPALFEYLMVTRACNRKAGDSAEDTALKEEWTKVQRQFAKFFSTARLASARVPMSRTAMARYVALPVVTVVALCHFAFIGILLGRLKHDDKETLVRPFAGVTVGVVMFWFWFLLRLVTMDTTQTLWAVEDAGTEGAILFALCIASLALSVFWIAKHGDNLLGVVTLAATVAGAAAFVFRSTLAGVLEDPRFYGCVALVFALIALSVLNYENQPAKGA